MQIGDLTVVVHHLEADAERVSAMIVEAKLLIMAAVKIMVVEDIDEIVTGAWAWCHMDQEAEYLVKDDLKVPIV